MRDLPSTTGGVGMMVHLGPNIVLPFVSQKKKNIVLPFAILVAMAEMRTKDMVNHQH
jgi:hypothetical protein